MFENPRRRLLTVFFTLFSLLFMQLAVAGYACPNTSFKAAERSAMAVADIPCAQSMTTNMDEEQPNLCKAHCLAGQQVADKYEVPAPVAITDLPAAFTLPIVLTALLAVPVQAPHLKRTTAPPLAILNCCFRI